MRYPTPQTSIDQPHEAVHEARKSRFISWCARIDHPGQIDELIAHATHRHPDAGHRCWAYICGAPETSVERGCSDDGEPGGTAGRPMLQVLEGSGLGDIACVVIRYFGGTLLGTGGLARAYGQSVRACLAELPSLMHVPTRRLVVALAFSDEQPAREWLGAHEGRITGADYHPGGVDLSVDWPTDRSSDFVALNARLDGRLAGRVRPG